MATRRHLLVEAAIRYESAAQLLTEAAGLTPDEPTAGAVEPTAGAVEPARPAANPLPRQKFIGGRMHPRPPPTPPPGWMRPLAQAMPKQPSAPPRLADEAALEEDTKDFYDDAEDYSKGFYYTGKGGSKAGKAKHKRKGKEILKSSSKVKSKGMTKGNNKAK